MAEIIILLGDAASKILYPLNISLQTNGYLTTLAHNKQTVLALAKAGPVHSILADLSAAPQQIIADCQALRQVLHGTNIIGLAPPDEETHSHALDAGLDIVLLTPINESDLAHWLNTPRTIDDHIMAEGALHGFTNEDVASSTALLAHDLKSPISVIISSLEVVNSFQGEAEIPEAIWRLLQGALNAAYRQINMISNMIDLARLETGSYDFQTTEFDLIELLLERLQAEEYTFTAKGLVMQQHLPPTPLIVNADMELIQQAISAIIDSVVKFTVRGDEFHIYAFQQADQIILRFMDNGRPLPADFTTDIMHRAPQWERRQAGGRTSVGLSLPFVYRVALAHDGSFTAHSENGYTVFTFSLPA